MKLRTRKPCPDRNTSILRDVYLGEHNVATITGRRDWVKVRETDRIRTRMAWRWSLVFYLAGLGKVFPGVDFTFDMFNRGPGKDSGVLRPQRDMYCRPTLPYIVNQLEIIMARLGLILEERNDG